MYIVQVSPSSPCDIEQEKGQMPEEKRKENEEGQPFLFYLKQYTTAIIVFSIVVDSRF